MQHSDSNPILSGSNSISAHRRPAAPEPATLGRRANTSRLQAQLLVEPLYELLGLPIHGPVHLPSSSRNGNGESVILSCLTNGAGDGVAAADTHSPASSALSISNTFAISAAA
uniref:Uncharacterized protein n=1 Tax=Ananas comosus var. bracteatus TaxID=296719 RepID=A0A6V7QJ92_ANACO|nr:unnamed protein product [Ananas comosus var. bracteatus]